MGTLSGPRIVLVSGYSGKPAKAAISELAHPWGTTLFVEHRYEIDFPAEASTHDFEITK